MFRYGMSDGVALEQARSLVYTAEADIPQYERAVKQTRLSLDILLGETPQAADSTGSGLRLLADRHPADIPVGLPSELLKRRPDIMEARYNMLQAAANAGAHAGRFPSIALTAKGGIASNSIKGLTAANPWAWDALGSLTQPLFAFGKLRRSEMAAMERYTQAAKTYEQTVLTAFADVEKALVAIATYRTQTERSCELVVSNDRIATMTQALYRSGLSDYLDVIDAERSLYQSQMELVQHRGTAVHQLREPLQGTGRRVVRPPEYTHKWGLHIRPQSRIFGAKTKERQCVYPNLKPASRPRSSR